MWEILRHDAPQLLSMLGLLVLSGLFSGSETALFALRPMQLNHLRRKGGPINNAILALHKERGESLMTVLLCNMTVNILFFASSTVIASDVGRVMGPGGSFIFGIVCLLAVITAGEVTPKSIATVAQTHFARLMAIPLFFFHRLFWPIRILLNKVVIVAERLAGVEEPTPALQAEELKLLVEASREEGVISSSEQEFISEVIDLPQVRVREMMTPRVDLVTVTRDATAEEVLTIARASQGHSKIPVRDPESEEIVGWVDARELFVSSASGPIGPHVKKPFFVSEFDRADRMLQLFRQKTIRLAVVVDERGETMGVATLSDVVAEIFGEIGDEDLPAEEPIREVGEASYILAGDVSVRDWRNLVRIAESIPQTATVGGLVTALLGRTARVGDEVELGNLHMEVLGMHGRRISEIRLTLPPEDASETQSEANAEGERP